jgi:RNA polymerase sigma-70 factor, ECF subfamily
MNLSDKGFIQRIRQGDKDVFKTIYDLYYQRMKLYAISYVEDNDSAEDIVQELLFHLWEKREDLEQINSISSYLFKSVHNRCIQYLRHKRVVARYKEKHLLKIKDAEIMSQSGFDFSLNEIEEIKEQIVNSLSPKTRKIFQLSRIEEKNNQEIAATLDLSVKTVEYHITKALKSFQLALRDYILLFFLFISFIL